VLLRPLAEEFLNAFLGDLERERRTGERLRADRTDWTEGERERAPRPRGGELERLRLRRSCSSLNFRADRIFLARLGLESWRLRWLLPFLVEQGLRLRDLDLLGGLRLLSGLRLTGERERDLLGPRLLDLSLLAGLLEPNLLEGRPWPNPLP